MSMHIGRPMHDKVGDPVSNIMDSLNTIYNIMSTPGVAVRLSDWQKVFGSYDEEVQVAEVADSDDVVMSVAEPPYYTDITQPANEQRFRLSMMDPPRVQDATVNSEELNFDEHFKQFEYDRVEGDTTSYVDEIVTVVRLALECILIPSTDFGTSRQADMFKEVYGEDVPSLYDRVVPVFGVPSGAADASDLDGANMVVGGWSDEVRKKYQLEASSSNALRTVPKVFKNPEGHYAMSACSHFVYTHIINKVCVPLSPEVRKTTSYDKVIELIGSLNPFPVHGKQLRDFITSVIQECQVRLKAIMDGESYHLVQHMVHARPNQKRQDETPILVTFNRTKTHDGQLRWFVGSETTWMLEGMVLAVNLVNALKTNTNDPRPVDDKKFMHPPPETLRMSDSSIKCKHETLMRRKGKKATNEFETRGIVYNARTYADFLHFGSPNVYNQCGNYFFGAEKKDARGPVGTFQLRSTTAPVVGTSLRFQDLVDLTNPSDVEFRVRYSTAQWVINVCTSKEVWDAVQNEWRNAEEEEGAAAADEPIIMGDRKRVLERVNVLLAAHQGVFNTKGFTGAEPAHVHQLTRVVVTNVLEYYLATQLVGDQVVGMYNDDDNPQGAVAPGLAVRRMLNIPNNEQLNILDISIAQTEYNRTVVGVRQVMNTNPIDIEEYRDIVEGVVYNLLREFDSKGYTGTLTNENVIDTKHGWLTDEDAQPAPDMPISIVKNYGTDRISLRTDKTDTYSHVFGMALKKFCEGADRAVKVKFDVHKKTLLRTNHTNIHYYEGQRLCIPAWHVEGGHSQLVGYIVFSKATFTIRRNGDNTVELSIDWYETVIEGMVLFNDGLMKQVGDGIYAPKRDLTVGFMNEGVGNDVMKMVLVLGANIAMWGVSSADNTVLEETAALAFVDTSVPFDYAVAQRPALRNPNGDVDSIPQNTRNDATDPFEKSDITTDVIVDTLMETFQGLHFSNSRALRRTILAVAVNDNAQKIREFLSRPLKGRYGRAVPWAHGLGRGQRVDPNAVLLKDLYDHHETSTTRATDPPMSERVVVETKGPGPEDLPTTTYVDGWYYRTHLFYDVEKDVMAVMKNIASNTRTRPSDTVANPIIDHITRCFSIYDVLRIRPHTATNFKKLMVDIYENMKVAQHTKDSRNRTSMHTQVMSIDRDVKTILFRE